MMPHGRVHPPHRWGPSHRRGSRGSVASPLSVLSAVGMGNILSVASVFSIASAGSILSIGSAGSILSIGSAGSILSIGSVNAVLSIGGNGTVLNRRRPPNALGATANQKPVI